MTHGRVCLTDYPWFQGYIYTLSVLSQSHTNIIPIHPCIHSQNEKLVFLDTSDSSQLCKQVDDDRVKSYVCILFKSYLHRKQMVIQTIHNMTG